MTGSMAELIVKYAGLVSLALVLYQFWEARRSKVSLYIEAEEEERGRKNAEQEIDLRLAGDDFDTFYPLFDMKDRFQRTMIERLGLTPSDLAQTKWFGQRLRGIMS